MCLSEENIRGQRNFANKIWNIARFILTDSLTDKNKGKAKENKDDQWIKEELTKTTKKVTQALEEFRLNEGAEEIYDFTWHKLADVYLEKVKERRGEAQTTLEEVLEKVLKLLHPFMPYVTETIWSLKHKDLLINASWPEK